MLFALVESREAKAAQRQRQLCLEHFFFSLKVVVLKKGNKAKKPHQPLLPSCTALIWQG